MCSVINSRRVELLTYLGLLRYPKNLYPSPCTVTMYSGFDGFASSFCRNEAT